MLRKYSSKILREQESKLKEAFTDLTPFLANMTRRDERHDQLDDCAEVGSASCPLEIAWISSSGS